MLLRRLAITVALGALLGASVIATLGIATTWSFHRGVRDIQREVGRMCDVAERSRWAPAPLERSWCATPRDRRRSPRRPGVDPMLATEIGEPARDLADRVDARDVARWRRELAQGAPATEGEARIDATELRHAICDDHDTSFFADAPPALEHALIPLLAHASRMPADECLAESTVVVQLAHRLAHSPVPGAYEDALGTTGLVGRTVARCAALASPAARGRAAEELDALASQVPPWLGPSTWSDYVLAHDVASHLALAADGARWIWPWSTSSHGEPHRDWLRDRASIALGRARRVRGACDADAGATPLSDVRAEHAALRVHESSSACLRELAAGLRSLASEGSIAEHAILAGAPSCAASE